MSKYKVNSYYLIKRHDEYTIFKCTRIVKTVFLNKETNEIIGIILQTNNDSYIINTPTWIFLEYSSSCNNTIELAGYDTKLYQTMHKGSNNANN